jgi:hypothetical protein
MLVGRIVAAIVVGFLLHGSIRGDSSGIVLTWPSQQGVNSSKPLGLDPPNVLDVYPDYYDKREARNYKGTDRESYDDMIIAEYDGEEYNIRFFYQLLTDQRDPAAVTPRIHLLLRIYSNDDCIREILIGEYISGSPGYVPITAVDQHTFDGDVIGVCHFGFGGFYELAVVVHKGNEIVIYYAEATAFTEPPPKEIARVDLSGIALKPSGCD